MKQSKIIFEGLRALQRELSKDEWQETRYTILLDENTFQYCLPRLVSSVEVLQEADFIEVPVGEECKSMEVAAQVWQTLLEDEADRQHVIVNLGGGSVCDLGGFVAAGYKRGIRHIHVPTTLLGMVDAAIGGKTAIDFGGVKNSIGHFYPSTLTCMEPAFLDTLPTEELLNGQMEMVKTAAVSDSMMFMEMMQTNTPFKFAPLRSQAVSPAEPGREGVPEGRVRVSKQQIVNVARIKARVVKADPYDHSIRKILNFGHTFGHAIEVYRGLPHGLAVGIGMEVAMYLSTKKLGFSEEVYHTYSQWIKAWFSSINFRFSLFTLKDIEQMLPLMHQDKKNADGEFRCVLLQEPGAAVIDITVSDNEVRDAFLHIKEKK